MKGTCRICHRDDIREWLDFGLQAIRNRYLRSPGEKEYRHALKLGVCRQCGTVQLADPPPVAEVRPRFDWISYNEPERHLDELVSVLTRLPGITTGSTFAGLTYKDDSSLCRLNRLGFARTWRPDLRVDLQIYEANAGIETVQERLTPETAVALAKKFDRPDVLLVRHVLEHTHDTRLALEWAARLVRPDGYIVFEVPDTVRALDRLDYTTVWEEHVLYFSPYTLRGCLEQAGFEVVSLESYPYTLENSLVAIARSTGCQAQPKTGPGEVARAERFVREFPRVRDRLREQLVGHGRIAMLGAGHLTGAFINLHGLEDQIEFVADDNANKQSLFMPGSRRPILPSSELVSQQIDLCLMTVRPEIEDVVAAKNAAFTSRGGVLASVFPDSPYALSRVLEAVA